MMHPIPPPPLNRLVAIHSAPAQMKSGVIHVKSAIKTWSRAVQRIENQRPDKSSRMIPMLMQDVRQIGKPGRERNAKIVDVIELRVRSREYGRVRCRCQEHTHVQKQQSKKKKKKKKPTHHPRPAIKRESTIGKLPCFARY